MRGSLEERFWAKVRKGPGCWEWRASKTRGGYGQFAINGTPRRVHRVAWFLTTGTWPTRHLLHRCDNRLCVRLSHMFEGTAADNSADAVVKGRTARGSRNGCVKLSEEQVRQIRLADVSSRTLAVRYDISQAHINQIKSRRRWGWLK